MKKAVLAAAALACVAVSAPPAAAHETVTGGCNYNGWAPSGPDAAYTGLIWVTATASSGNLPVAGTHWDCELLVNGAVVARVSATSNALGKAADGNSFSHRVEPGQIRVLCTRITFLDGHVWTNCP